MYQSKAVLILTMSVLVCANSVYAANSYVGGSLGVGGRASQPGASANLFAGYGGKVRNDLYLGGEMNAEYGLYGSKHLYGMGLSLMPGIMVTDNTKFYLRAGEEIVKDTHKTETVNFGPVYGLGVQTKLNKKWDLRGEAKHSLVSSDTTYNLGLVYNLGK